MGKKKAAQKAAKEKKKKEKEAAEREKEKEEGVIEMGEGGFDISEAADVGGASTPTNTTSTDAAATATTPLDASSGSTTPAPEGNDNEEDEDDNSPPPLGNGATVPDRYTWTQTLSEVNLSTPLPPNSRAKEIKVTISKTQLHIQLHRNKTTIVSSALTKPVIVDDSFWTIEDGDKLVITLQKLNQMEWWDCVCEDDAVKIDVKKVQPEDSKLSDLDGDTRQTVEKMMFDQRQKALGLPSSDEQRKMEMLEKFKKAHPEMDFSNA